MTSQAPFGDRLATALATSKTPLCMGIDPHKALMSPLFCDASGAPFLVGLRDFSLNLVEAARVLCQRLNRRLQCLKLMGQKASPS